MGKILCYIYNDMADFEMTLACSFAGQLLEKELVTIAYTKEIVTSKPGVTYQPKATVKDSLEFTDVEGLIIPGGWNDELRPELKELIQKLNKENKMLSAICAGPQFLAKSGVLDDKKYTTTLTKSYLDEQDIEDFFPRANFKRKKVVRDKNIITAVGRSFVDFAVEIADYFGAFDDPKNKINKRVLAKYYKG